jgi:hypothetical protein
MSPREKELYQTLGVLPMKKPAVGHLFYGGSEGQSGDHFVADVHYQRQLHSGFKLTEERPVTSSDFGGLSADIRALRSDIQELTATIKRVFPIEPEPLVFRDITREQATVEISMLLRGSSEAMYPSDISEELRIDYDLVTDILNELKVSGKVQFSS